MDMAPGRRRRYLPWEPVAVIVLQLAGAGAGVAAARAVGGGPARGAEYLIRPFPVSPAAERAAGRGSVLAAIVAAAWLTWASLRHDFDLRWWSVLGPLLPAGILAGFIWRVFTTRVGGPLGTGCVILSACPVLAALLGWAVTRSLTLL